MVIGDKSIGQLLILTTRYTDSSVMRSNALAVGVLMPAVAYWDVVFEFSLLVGCCRCLCREGSARTWCTCSSAAR